MTSPGPKVPESPAAADTAEIDEGWGDADDPASAERGSGVLPTARPTEQPASTKPPVIRTPVRPPLASAPEIIVGEELSLDIIAEIDPDPIEYDGDAILSQSRPTLPVLDPLKYDIPPDSERNTEIPPEPRVPKIPDRLK